MARNYKVMYIRRPRVRRAWGKNTKTHILYLIFATSEEARVALIAARRWADTRDSVRFAYTEDPPTDVSVEDMTRGLWLWKEAK